MKIDLSDLQVGDKLFSIASAEASVAELHNERTSPFSIRLTNPGYWITRDGKKNSYDSHPTHFHSLNECIEYFQSVKKNIEKKRYWIWTLVDSTNCPYKSDFYMDDDGKYPNGETNADFKYNSVRIKHDTEFIEL